MPAQLSKKNQEWKDINEEMGHRPVWTQLKDEPDYDFSLFVRFFLSLGGRRTITRAQIAFNKSIEGDPDAKNLSIRAIHERYFWSRRAIAYDQNEQENRAADAINTKHQLQDKRCELLDEWYDFTHSVIKATEPDNSKQVRAASSAFTAFMNQARQESDWLSPQENDSKDSLYEKYEIIRGGKTKNVEKVANE